MILPIFPFSNLQFSQSSPSQYMLTPFFQCCLRRRRVPSMTLLCLSCGTTTVQGNSISTFFKWHSESKSVLQSPLLLSSLKYHHPSSSFCNDLLTGFLIFSFLAYVLSHKVARVILLNAISHDALSLLGSPHCAATLLSIEVKVRRLIYRAHSYPLGSSGTFPLSYPDRLSYNPPIFPSAQATLLLLYSSFTHHTLLSHGQTPGCFLYRNHVSDILAGLTLSPSLEVQILCFSTIRGVSRIWDLR